MFCFTFFLLTFLSLPWRSLTQVSTDSSYLTEDPEAFDVSDCGSHPPLADTSAGDNGIDQDSRLFPRNSNYCPTRGIGPIIKIFFR